MTLFAVLQVRKRREAMDRRDAERRQRMELEKKQRADLNDQKRKQVRARAGSCSRHATPRHATRRSSTTIQQEDVALVMLCSIPPASG